MDINRFTQPVLVVGLIIFLFLLLWVPVPASNMEMVKMCVTAVISFISGATVARAAMGDILQTKKGDSPDEKTIATPPPGAAA